MLSARKPCSLVRSTLAVSLAALLAGSPVIAEAGALPAATKTLPAAPRRAALLSPGERALHTLNRFTFGPRPGDVAAVSRLGVDRWFEQQLNPQTIDDSALERRLSVFPAMGLRQQQLVERFPSNQLIRSAAHGALALPADPTTHAIYTDAIAFYNEEQARKAAALPSTDVAEARAGRLRHPDLLGPASRYTVAYGPKKTAANAIADPSATTSDGAVPLRERTGSRHKEDFYSETAARAILDLPPAARVTRLLHLPPADLVAFRRSLSADELTTLSADLAPAQQETLAALQSPQRLVTAELLGSRLERDVYSDRQLEAVMTDFWLNHFNVFLHKNDQEPYLLPSFERDTIRHNALGHFETLLTAVASSPAMLVYLDNAQSIGPDSPAAVTRTARLSAKSSSGQPKAAAAERGLNENYARELLELHTLGVRCEVSKDHTPTDPTCGRGYMQADITEVAKVLTGWTVDRPAFGSAPLYDDRRHEPGDKIVLGTKIPGNGEREGLQLFHLLATSPATARFVSTRLAIRFVSDNPPPALVARMTSAWLGSNGDLRVVLRTLFHSPEFWASANYRDKVKTPIEFVASSLRAGSAEITNPAALVASLDRLGMPLYGMQTPNGYSWLSEPWVSTSALVTRMNFALSLASDRIPGVTLHVADAPSASPASEAALETSILGESVSEKTRRIILQQSADSSLPQQAAKDFLFPVAHIPSLSVPSNQGRQEQQIRVGLLLGSPEFQRR